MLSHPLSLRFSEALVLAADLHRYQPRKGTEIPYTSHILAVASIALEFGATEDEAIAALLHDAIEDAPEELGPGEANWARRLIEYKFGPDVLAIVEANTDAEVKPKPPWPARKAQYIAGIPRKSASTVLVSVADKLHNARAILTDFRAVGDEVFERFNKEAGQAGTLGYYRALVSAFQARVIALQDRRVQLLVDELDRAVGALETAVGAKGQWPLRNLH